MAENSGTQPTLQEFMAAMFPEDLLEEGEAPILATAMPDQDSPGNYVFPVSRFHKRAKRSQATHTCISTFGSETNDSGRLTRRKTNLRSVWMLQLDDVGTKSKVPPIEPSVIIETSPENYTYLYLFDEPTEDWQRYEHIAESLKAAGYGDPNCADAVRLFRLPGSKPGGKEHAAKVILWRPERTFPMESLLDEFEVAEVARRSPSDPNPLPAPPGMAVRDEVLDWLDANGHLISPDTDGFYKIKCPWSDTHSDARDMAKYKPATEENLRRVYWCWHTHAQEAGEWGDPHGTEDFLRWVEEQGGPRATVIKDVRSLSSLAEATGAAESAASGPFPGPALFGGTDWLAPQEEAQEAQQRRGSILDELTDRYVWYTPKGQMFDLQGPKDYPLMTVQGVTGKWAAYRLPALTPTGRDTTVNVVQKWIGLEDKKETSSLPHLDPRVAPGWTGEFINTWRPLVTTATPNPTGAAMFETLVRHAFPEDADFALDWMASKVQRPWLRQTALVSYTPTFGTGRGSIMAILSAILGNAVNVSASKVIGKHANQFNGYLNALLICVHEVAEGADDERGAHISRATYERLKELCDPDRRHYMMERKGIDAEEMETFASTFIATNAPDGLPLERGDRRFSVTRGNNVPLIDAHPEVVQWLAGGGAEDEAMLVSIGMWLAERDVSGFHPSVAHKSAAKDDMINAATSPMDQLFEELTEGYPVVTAQALAEAAYKTSRIARHHGEGKVEVMAIGWLKKRAQKTAHFAQGKLKRQGVMMNVWELEPQATKDVVREELEVYLKAVMKVDRIGAMPPRYLKEV